MLAELKLVEDVLSDRIKKKTIANIPLLVVPARMEVEDIGQSMEMPITDPYIVVCTECNKKFYSNYDVQSLFYV